MERDHGNVPWPVQQLGILQFRHQPALRIDNQQRAGRNDVLAVSGCLAVREGQK